MTLLLTLVLFLTALLSAFASAQPHQRHTPTPAIFDNEKPLHTTALMSGAAWSLSRDAATRTTVARARTTVERGRTRPTVGVLMEL
ncbi:hypothetical protein P171DRAFT_433012 [Karstenula rhodostoma CBS 690.94]|uniref:Secreted protein n=1 Tax=Karstenula rhodostoma CBS 690.94 TaxID=1392251 RepID=A0A9P4PJ77_9PLEO|nr:hypothetical protein P171DRAFT_433012 [Karstenula rhodostoma CBS 690.94]